jgi:transcriptional regulator with XRE-family HTH domain
MSDHTTLGSWLRREREKRGVTLAKISEETKVAVPLLEGLEADDLSRWPGGIFRRSFARSYASAIGLDPELVVRRVEEEHPSEPGEPTTGLGDPRSTRPPVTGAPTSSAAVAAPIARPDAAAPVTAVNTRIQAVALDLLVAGAIGFGFAAAGSRLLWPVIVIAAYHALGLLLTGTTPMMAVLAQSSRTAIEPQPRAAASASAEPAAMPARRPEPEPRHVRRARARRSKDQGSSSKDQGGKGPKGSDESRVRGAKDLTN